MKAFSTLNALAFLFPLFLVSCGFKVGNPTKPDDQSEEIKAAISINLTMNRVLDALSVGDYTYRSRTDFTAEPVSACADDNPQYIIFEHSSETSRSAVDSYTYLTKLDIADRWLDGSQIACTDQNQPGFLSAPTELNIVRTFSQTSFRENLSDKQSSVLEYHSTSSGEVEATWNQSTQESQTQYDLSVQINTQESAKLSLEQTTDDISGNLTTNLPLEAKLTLDADTGNPAVLIKSGTVRATFQELWEIEITFKDAVFSSGNCLLTNGLLGIQIVEDEKTFDLEWTLASEDASSGFFDWKGTPIYLDLPGCLLTPQ